MEGEVIMSRQGRAAGRAGAAAVAMAAGAVVSVLPASGAQAAGTLVADVICSPQGANIIECVNRITGGTAPYSTAWSGAYFTYTNTWAAGSNCTTNKYYTISVVVTDAAGVQATDQAYSYCRSGPPI
jgi:hypothetical protein